MIVKPDDQAVRDEALDPTRSFIVEAPAGSGKTELLTRRLLRLLSCVDKPEEVLAITFTRKAAAEMRRRVLDALASAANEAPATESKAALWALARAALDADLRHGWQLRTHPARLRIMTIDALNSSLARQLPILSGTGAMLPVERDVDALYAQVSLRLMERLADRDSTSDAVARLMRHLDNQSPEFNRLLVDELKRREYWLDLGILHGDSADLRERLEHALEELVTSELAGLCERIPARARAELPELASFAANTLQAASSQSRIALCGSLAELPGTETQALHLWQGLAELLLTSSGSLRKPGGVNKNIGFPPTHPSMKERMAGLLARLEGESDFAEALHRVRSLPEPRYSDHQWRVLTDLITVLRAAIGELEVVMREHGGADHVANAIAARRALGGMNEPSDLALRLDYRLKHLLVDEFQDTSRGQVELLGQLTAGWTEGDGRTLFCVGDPMQSIYRFRNADVGLFLNLRNSGLNHLRLVPLRLRVNFRSARPVLDWINSAFAAILPHYDDPERGAVSFTASDVGPQAQSAGGVFVHPILGNKRSARASEARQVADVIEQARAAGSTKIAVLVATRRHLESIVGELRDRRIPFNAVDIDPLAQRPAILDLVALTRALVHLADRTAWLAVLRAPWCGLSMADLHCLVGDSDFANETIWEALSDEARVASMSDDGRDRVARLRRLLELALQIRGRSTLRECVERTWHRLGGPATVASTSELDDCSAYFDRLESLEKAGDLEDSARLIAGLADLYARPEAGSAAVVELMTIHRAKGLEFDVVLLPGLDRAQRAEGRRLLRVHESSRLSRYKLALAPVPARGKDADTIYRWLNDQDRDREAWERGRLLYVAATRACRELHLFGAAELSDTGVVPPRPKTFLHVLWSVIQASFEGSTQCAPVDSDIESTDRVSTWRLPLSWLPPLPAPTVINGGRLDLRTDEVLHPQFEWAGETARHVGTLAHREIERIARIEGSHSSVRRDSVSWDDTEVQYAVALAELGVPPSLRATAATRVRSAIANMLDDERGKWLLGIGQQQRDVASEFALTGLVDGLLVNGIIDRTFLDEEGTCWIVDFKTSFHEGGALDAFLDSEVQRYRPQLRRYAVLMKSIKSDRTIRAALYFPLLRAWREVEL